MHLTRAALAAVVIVAACGPSSPRNPFLTCSATPPDPVIACTNPVQPAAVQTGQILLHATARVGTKLTFDVPLNTASLTIVEQAVTAPATVTVSTGASSVAVENMAVPFAVTDPTGRVIYEDNQNFDKLSQVDREQLLAYVPAAGAGAGTLVIPGTTGGLALVGSGGLPKGTWTLQVSDVALECACLDWSPGSCRNGSTSSLYDVTVVAKPLVASAIPTSGTIDLTVYFATTSAGAAPALDATTASAGQDQDLNRMVSSLSSLLAKAGITLGRTTYVMLPQSVLDTYATGVNISTLDACSPLAQLFRNGASGQTLNVFFVSAFKGGDVVSGKTVVGLDGSIPGPATIGGSAGSGVAISTVDLRINRSACSGALNLSCGADLTAYFIAHESGHYLGLSHTTELYGYRYDAVSDTAACPCSSCKATSDKCATSDSDVTSTSHTMTVAECTTSTTCGGGENLMFWTLSSSASKGSLSAEQRKIVLANPLVQ